MASIYIFCTMQFINVVLGTLRSICTIKANPHIGMLMNVISYTFYAAVVKLLTEQKLWIVVVVTAITNCFGFYLAQFLFKKFQKDKLWRITATLPKENRTDNVEIGYQLNKYDIQYNINDIGNSFVLDIFSKTQGESALIKEILNKPNVKYHVIEIDKTL